MSHGPPAAGGQQDSYTPSTDAGDQPVSYKQMLAASAGVGIPLLRQKFGADPAVGGSVMDNIRASAPHGTVFAYDVRTGKEAWRFHTIPAPGEPGSETWSGDDWEHGGASTWVWYADREMPALPVPVRSRDGESRRHALMTEDPPRVSAGDRPDGNTIALAASQRGASTDLTR